MLSAIVSRNPPFTTPLVTAHRRTQSVVTALLRQDIVMSSVKRESWTEDDIEALPLGEHDYFERKSGLLFEDTGRLLGTLAKAISALANSDTVRF